MLKMFLKSGKLSRSFLIFVCPLGEKFPAWASHSWSRTTRPRTVGEYEYCLLSAWSKKFIPSVWRYYFTSSIGFSMHSSFPTSVASFHPFSNGKVNGLTFPILVFSNKLSIALLYVVINDSSPSLSSPSSEFALSSPDLNPGVRSTGVIALDPNLEAIGVHWHCNSKLFSNAIAAIRFAASVHSRIFKKNGRKHEVATHQQDFLTI